MLAVFRITGKAFQGMCEIEPYYSVKLNHLRIHRVQRVVVDIHHDESRNCYQGMCAYQYRLAMHLQNLPRSEFV